MNGQLPPTGFRADERSGAPMGRLYVGWHDLLPDESLNFQLNRWAAYGGPVWLADVRPVLGSLVDYASWKDTFVALGERALTQSRVLDAALHFRSAEFLHDLL